MKLTTPPANPEGRRRRWIGDEDGIAGGGRSGADSDVESHSGGEVCSGDIFNDAGIGAIGVEVEKCGTIGGGIEAGHGEVDYASRPTPEERQRQW